MKLTIKQLKQMIKEQVEEVGSKPNPYLSAKDIEWSLAPLPHKGVSGDDKILFKSRLDSFMDKCLDAGKQGGMRNSPELERRITALRAEILSMFNGK